jgi:hypothetical protein
MNPRRAFVGISAAALLAAGILAGPVGAGVQAPHDMIASPNTGPVGTHITISNAENSPCGAQKGDGPAEVAVTVTKPDEDDSDTFVVPDEAGNWEVVYIDTDQVGTYVVDAYCGDAPETVSTNATDFTYTQASFVVTAQTPSTTAAPTTTSTAAPASAVDATAAFTG